MKKYPFGDIAVERSLTDICIKKLFTLDFTENGAGREFVFDNPFFYIFDERIILAEFSAMSVISAVLPAPISP